MNYENLISIVMPVFNDPVVFCKDVLPHHE